VLLVPDAAGGKPHLSLTLIPTPPPVPPQNDPSAVRDETVIPSGYFRFNDTATNAMLAVGGAAVIGSMIAALLKHH
jgi:hypothetical protein